ncbi:MAG: aminoacyl-tRNA hydrolase [Candidatus Hydrogenedentota bacterium]
MSLKLIIGLGNPGPQYKNTRHNIGFQVLDQLADELGVDFSREKFKGQIAEARVRSHKVVLLKPMTFMNKSGESAAQAARNGVDDPQQILVIYDDVDLPLGKIRIRKNGSAGTHNGMKSIIEYLGTREVPRIRIGIGSKQPGGDLSGHVLGKFHPDEIKDVKQQVEQAVQAIHKALDTDLDQAMNAFNKN